MQTYAAESAKEFAEKIYRAENMEYPKFFKMDTLSKFGLLAAEFVLKNTIVDPNTSLIFANASASLDTDILYNEKIAKNGSDFRPSPALFVYTLPNIMMGEVCIKHKIQGENIFYVMPEFDSSAITATVNTHYKLGKATSFILAWVEVLEEDFDIFACILKPTSSNDVDGQDETNIEFNNTTLKLLYNGTNNP